MIRRLLAWWMGRRDDTVSAQWRHEHAQRDGREGVDLVCWKVPRRGVANARWTALRVVRRKRA